MLVVHIIHPPTHSIYRACSTTETRLSHPLRCILFCQEHFRISIHYNERSAILTIFVIKCVNVLRSRTSEVELHIAPAREECMTHSINDSTKKQFTIQPLWHSLADCIKTHELDNTFFKAFFHTVPEANNISL